MSQGKKKIADDLMKKMEKKLNDAKDSNAGWGQTVQIVFPDAETGYRMKFAMDGSVEKIEKKPASEINPADAVTTMTALVQDLKDVMDGKVSGMDAYGDGRLKSEGDVMTLMRLAPAFQQ